MLEVMYGSRARGDHDVRSDTDVLRIGPGAGACGYGWDEIAQMASYGSLFLVHISLEGKFLSGEAADRHRLQHLMEEMPPYQRVRQDLSAFNIVLSDVHDSLRRGDVPIEYEGAVVAKLVRHLSILACYLAGEPNFTRYESVAIALQRGGLEQPPREHSFEKIYETVLDPENSVQVESVRYWMSVAKELIRALGGREAPNE